MNEIESANRDSIRQEQVLAAARALASWAHARQAAWSGEPIPVHPPVSLSQPAVVAPESSPSDDFVTSGLTVDEEQPPVFDAGAMAARAAALAAWGSKGAAWAARLAQWTATGAWRLAPTAGRALVRFALAGALIAIIGSIIVGGRKGIAYWRRHPAAISAASAVVATADLPKRTAPPATPRPARGESPESPARTLASLELPKLPARVDGWIKIVSPFKVTVSENGQPLWLYDDTARLSPGAHHLRFENQQLGYQSDQEVVVHPGGQTTVSVVPPPSTLTINAPSDSEVWIDGTAVGSAPLVNFSIALGMHDVLVKGPAGAERRLSLTVTPDPVVLTVQF
jgi:hypothetical protein